MKHLLLLLVIVSLACFAPAGQKKNTAKTVIVTDADNGKTFKLKAKDHLVVRLAENRTTGYCWAVTQTPGCLKLKGETKYEPIHTEVTPIGYPGGTGGTLVATYTATKAGKGKLTFVYSQPWEKDVPPIKTFTINVEVPNRPR